MTTDGPAGFDVTLMQRIAEILGRDWQLVRYQGADFNGIFGGLADGSYDCVASGTTVTPGRQKIADFCPPYAVSGQSLIVDVERHPKVHGISDLKGLVIGVQQGNTSQPVANRLVTEHRAARVRVYAHDEIEQALDDLTTGGCDAFMKLAPVTAWFVRDRRRLKVVETGITEERLGICVRKGNTALRDVIGQAQDSYGRRHTGGPDQSLAGGGGDHVGMTVGPRPGSDGQCTPRSRILLAAGAERI